MSPDTDRDVLDQETMRRVCAGDGHAFESLFLEYAGLLIGYARLIVQEPSIAEELVQEVFLHLWANRATLSISTSVRAYLYAATRNRAMNYVRHDRIERATADRFGVTDEHPEMSHGVEDVVAQLSDTELAAAIERAIEQLPRKTREVVRLRWYHHLTQAEIATALGVSLKTVESQMRNAFHAMRGELRRFRE